MRRDHCGGCGSADLGVFLDLGATPLADRFPATADEPEPTFPLAVAVCTVCWLVQLTEVVPDEVLWADYGFYSGASPGKAAAHKAYAGWALAEFGGQARRLTVEVGCNDGDLLRHFQAAGCKVVGIDPAEGPAEAARTTYGLCVLSRAFGRAAAGWIAEHHGPAGLVIANHVAAHAADPHGFFAGVAELLAPDGVALVEVQYLPDLLAGNQFDHVYHEHRFFYSVGSLSRVAAEHGLRVAQVIRSGQQGGSLRLVLLRGHDLAEHGSVGYERGRLGLEGMAPYESFQGRVDYIRGRLVSLIHDERTAGHRLAGYGATAKSATLLNTCGIGASLLEYVEDTTPYKIGRVTPGTHIPVVAPGDRDRPDTFLLLLWNDLAGVLRRERAFLDAGGRFLVPIPVPVLI
jgi:SAM-dependent methyltransferase